MFGNNSTTSNETIWESPVPPALQFGFGVIGNIIALIVLVTSAKEHKWRPFYRLVGGLAVTDGGGILLVYPTVMYRYATDFTYTFPKPLCDYSSFIYTFTLISSAMIVCAMSLDRFVAILYPFVYNASENERRTNKMLVVIWTLGFIISSLPLMKLGDSYNYYPGSWCFLNFVKLKEAPLERVNSFIYSIIGLIILSITIIVNITVIIAVCRNMRSDIKKSSSKKRLQNEIFIIAFLIGIVIVFSVCWAPLMVTIFRHAILSVESEGPTELLVLRLAVTNSVIDPWIYILLRRETLKGLKRIKKMVKKELGYIADSIHENNGRFNSTNLRRQCDVYIINKTQSTNISTENLGN